MIKTLQNNLAQPTRNPQGQYFDTSNRTEKDYKSLYSASLHERSHYYRYYSYYQSLQVLLLLVRADSAYQYFQL